MMLGEVVEWVKRGAFGVSRRAGRSIALRGTLRAHVCLGALCAPRSRAEVEVGLRRRASRADGLTPSGVTKRVDAIGEAGSAQQPP